MTTDEVMKYWRMADKKFNQSDKQPQDFINLANRLEKLAKHASPKLAAQWLEQAQTYKRIAEAVRKVERM